MNCSIVLDRRNHVVYPWKITSSQVSSITLRLYYHNVIEQQVKIPNDLIREQLRLSKGYLGKSKELLDLIDLDIDLQQAVGAFGSFIMEYGSTPYVGMAREKNGCRICSVQTPTFRTLL